MDHLHIMVYICLSSSFTASFWVVIMCDAMSRAGSCLHVVCMALHVVAHVLSRGSAQVRPFDMLMYCAAQRFLYLYSFSLPFIGQFVTSFGYAFVFGTLCMCFMVHYYYTSLHTFHTPLNALVLMPGI